MTLTEMLETLRKLEQIESERYGGQVQYYLRIASDCSGSVERVATDGRTETRAVFQNRAVLGMTIKALHRNPVQEETI